MKTMAGGKAAGIARWAWQDPPARVQQALNEVRELARAATDPAELAEIQDSGTMLSRLADSVAPQPVAALTADESIFVQLTAGSMVAEALELAGTHDAWRHERRGPHGEWIRGIGAPPGPRFIGEHEGGRTRQERIRQLARAREERLIKAEVARQQAAQASTSAPAPVQPGNRAAAVLDKAKAQAQAATYDPKHGYDPSVPTNAPPMVPASIGPEWEKEHEAFFQQRVKPHVEERAQKAVAEAQAKAAENTKKALDAQNAIDDQHEKHSAMLKAATEGSIAVAAGVLAYVEARLGVNDIIAVASSVGPILIQIIIEFWKRLLWPRLCHPRTASLPSTYSRRCSWTTGWKTTGPQISPRWSLTRPSRNASRRLRSSAPAPLQRPRAGSLQGGYMATVVVRDGRSKHRLYAAWLEMLKRCENPNHKQYKNYGGRGITVCPEWHDFWTYAHWIEENIGPRPDDWNITLDRIDNDQGYKPGNVRWADRLTQRLNGQPHHVGIKWRVKVRATR